MMILLLGASISLSVAVSNKLGEHQQVWGYVRYSDGTNIPDNVIVTITNSANGQSMTRVTVTASGGTGFYQLDVEDLNAGDGDTIIANVSYGGCEGNNSVIIDVTAPPQWCNVTIYGNLPPSIPSQPSGVTTGYRSISYNYSVSTTDPDGNQVYYWIDWDDGNNTGWLGPYNSGNTCISSHSWGTIGAYDVKVKAKDTNGAEIGAGWSNALSVSIVNQAPNTPSNPSPTDGATGVDINAILSWDCSDPDGDSLTYSVYLDIDDPTPDNLVSENQSATFFDPYLTYDDHYYWQIIAWDSLGDSTAGPVWDFTTMQEPNDPPYPPSDPDPEDGATDVDIDEDISWACSDPDGDLLTYDVYFEADNPTPDVLVSDDQTETTFDPGTLDYETTYYWKIVAKDSHSATTEGPIWHFTTEGGPIPDLDCSGTLSWTGVPPGSTVTGSFTVENIGEPNSLLDWEVESYPEWGTWTFDPENGENLAPEDNPITVNVEVVAPNQQNSDFAGEVKIVNTEDSSDYCIIAVSLATPVNLQSIALSKLSTLMTLSLFNRMLSIKMLFLQRFDRITSLNPVTPSNNPATEDIEDSSFSSDSVETQPSDSHSSETNEQISQNSQSIDSSSSSSLSSFEDSSGSSISKDSDFSESSTVIPIAEIFNK